MANRDRAKQMATRGFTAKEIKNTTGVSGKTARTIVGKNQPTDLSQFIDTQAGGTAGTLGVAAVQRAMASGLSARDVSNLAGKQGLGLGSGAQELIQSTPLKISDARGLGEAIRIAGSDGNIGRKELLKITNRYGNNDVGGVVQRLDKINAKRAGKNEAPIGLGSAAYNSLLKTPTSKTMWGKSMSELGLSDPYTDFGSGAIGQSIRQGKGTWDWDGTSVAGTGRVPRGQQVFGSYNGAPQLQIKPQATANAGKAGPYNGVFDDAFAATQAGQNTGAGAGAGTGTGDQLDYQSILDAIAGIQQPQFDMSALTDMFNTQFDQLRSEVATRDPIQLQMVGRNYGGDAIRARQRNRKTARDYRRSSLGIASANPAPTYNFSGGLTL